MLHTPRAMSDTIRAENIESGNDALYHGLVGAIIHITRSDLEKLGGEYRETTLKTVSKNAQATERMLLDAFSPSIPEMSKMGGVVELDLSFDMKEKLKWILPAILYLYTLRYGDIKWWELNTLLNTDKDEPYVLIFHVNRDATGKFFIKKMLLEKSNLQSSEGEEKDQ